MRKGQCRKGSDCEYRHLPPGHPDVLAFFEQQERDKHLEEERARQMKDAVVEYADYLLTQSAAMLREATFTRKERLTAAALREGKPTPDDYGQPVVSHDDADWDSSEPEAKRYRMSSDNDVL